ncbi:hypothetical protein BJX63DRAFT_431122 [Aspergillus granulosus]|uniref:NB-ARC domain-containing protein n=1 Tax=Aspergillus granulosus TaxID=176169 RepID=A0ABR4HJW4_9EURO
MDLASRIKQFDLTLVYESPSPLVDIVFVHGLNGHPHRTWTSTKTGAFWPVDLLPEVLDQSRVRILTYGYNANVTSFTDGASKDRILNHSETLAAKLAANRTIKKCSERPIIFVCHSLGGLVVKRALIYSRSVTNEKVEHLRSIYVSTYGILFLGTPHNGSEVAKWGLLLQNICSAVLPKKFMESSPQLVKALKTNNETLQNINSLFTDMIPRFHIYFFHETLSTDVKGTRELIVDETSAAPYADGVERMGIEADHSHMCKFDDENAPGYEAVAEALLRYSRDAPATIQERWREEEKTRMIIRTQKAREIFNDASIGPDFPPDRSALSGRTLSPPAPAHSLTMKEYELEEPSDEDSLNPVKYLPPPEKPPSPVSDLADSTGLSLSRSWQREPLWVVPSGFHRNATFFGMTKQLETLHTRLFKVKKRAETLTAVLIAGVPGSGKSHLARQYVYSHRNDYPGGIFWVDAKSRQSTYKCFWDIAQAATLTDGEGFQSPDTKSSSKYVDAVRQWLQARQDWLLVFDGVSFNHNDDINHFKQFLPFRERCSIIYTSIDKTLRKKQRLYEPYCLEIPPLENEDACKLLFKDLSIKRPTKEQMRKAQEIVTHYECLPLAIHAISHRLSATGKPIEKYHINSHLIDEKLAEPFLSIMHDLYWGEHFPALNLINLLSFLGHHVPVGLITLGKSFLEAWNIEIFTSSRHGERGDLDTTLGTLIRYGLIERTSDQYPLLQTPSPRSEKYALDPKALIPELSESQTESSQESFSATYHSSGVSDIIKIHSVVQGFCRDELKIMDKEIRDLPESSQANAGFYDSWLVVATRVFCTSFENAKCRMDRVDDCGSVKDYREYETHASQLLKNYPKRSRASYGIVADSLKQLKEALKTIRSEIDRISPSSSQESIRKRRSVFDRSSSSSSFPDSMESDGPSRQLTLDFSDEIERSESPEQRMSPQKVNLGPIIPHIFRGSTHEMDGLHSGYLSEDLGEEYKEDNGYLRHDGYLKNDGYATDDESSKGRSPAMSQISVGTERPRSHPSSPPQDDEGWHVVENPVRNRLVVKEQLARPNQRQQSQWRWQRRPLRRRPAFARNIGDSKPAAPVLEMTSAWRSAPEVIKAQGSPHRTASEALIAVSKGSPPASNDHLNRPRAAHGQKENAPTYAAVAKLAQHIPPNQTPSQLQPQPSNGLDALDLMGAPDSHYYGTHRISNPRVVPADLSASTPILGIPYESNIDVKVSRRVRENNASAPTPATAVPSAFTSKSSTSLSSINLHPSAIMPGASPPSASGSEPMSRNPSGQSQSQQSGIWSTATAMGNDPQYRGVAPRLSPLSSAFQPAQQQQNAQLLTGAGSWTSDTPTLAGQRVSSVPASRQGPVAGPGLSYAAVAQRRYVPPMDMGLDFEMDLEPEAQDSIWSPPASAAGGAGPTMHFGTHAVDLLTARQRFQAQTQAQGRGRGRTHLQPSQYHIYHDNRSGPLMPGSSSSRQNEFEYERDVGHDGGYGHGYGYGAGSEYGFGYDGLSQGQGHVRGRRQGVDQIGDGAGRGRGYKYSGSGRPRSGSSPAFEY